jgi:hypothetical protein
MHFRDFAFQRGDEQAHQQRHFVCRTAPVLRAEREQGQIFDTALNAGFHDIPYCFDAFSMPRHTRHETLGRPATVAIHDDGDMAGYRRNIRYRLRRADMRHVWTKIKLRQVVGKTGIKPSTALFPSRRSVYRLPPQTCQ